MADNTHVDKDGIEVEDLTQPKKPDRSIQLESAQAVRPAASKSSKPKTAEKAPHVKDSKKKAKHRTESHGSTLKGVFLTLLVVFLILGAAISALYFNVFSSKSFLDKTLGISAATTAERETQLTEWQTQLNNQAAQLKADQDALAQQQQNLSAQTEELDSIKNELENKNKAVDELKTQLETKITDITNVVKTLEGMDTDAAAAVLTAMEDQEYKVQLISLFKAATRSAILAAMDPTEAAAILRELG